MPNKEWSAMTPDEKREERFRRWLNPEGVKFNNAAAEKAYKERVTRFIKVMKLEEPDRVPVLLPAGTFPIYEAGMTYKDAMHDNKRAIAAYRAFFKEYQSDVFSGGMAPSARSNDILDNLYTKFPGRGLPDNAAMHNFVEKEYMFADEYDHLINDPSDFFFRVYLPRTLGALKPFANFEPFGHHLGLPTRFLGPAVLPEVQKAFQAIIDYGKHEAEWNKPMMEFAAEGLAAGYPSFMGGFTGAPYDILADTLRGTKGIVMDMYRQPEKVHAAMERLVPLMINAGVHASWPRGVVVFFALHKGDDAFMSDKQYETFYWPTFRKVIMGVIEAGMVPYLFAEGSYNNRLKTIKDLPKGKVIWYFDRTDMFKAKEVLGDRACLAGNVPTSLLRNGTKQQVKEYCRKLIEVCGKGGGYILAGGAALDKGKGENLKAMWEAANEYGVYRKK
jgi:uroporphyrinogen-III decarboxylase